MAQIWAAARPPSSYAPVIKRMQSEVWTTYYHIRSLRDKRLRFTHPKCHGVVLQLLVKRFGWPRPERLPDDPDAKRCDRTAWWYDIYCNTQQDLTLLYNFRTKAVFMVIDAIAHTITGYSPQGTPVPYPMPVEYAPAPETEPAREQWWPYEASLSRDVFISDILCHVASYLAASCTLSNDDCDVAKAVQSVVTMSRVCRDWHGALTHTAGAEALVWGPLARRVTTLHAWLGPAWLGPADPPTKTVASTPDTLIEPAPLGSVVLRPAWSHRVQLLQFCPSKPDLETAAVRLFSRPAVREQSMFFAQLKRTLDATPGSKDVMLLPERFDRFFRALFHLRCAEIFGYHNTRVCHTERATIQWVTKSTIVVKMAFKFKRLALCYNNDVLIEYDRCLKLYVTRKTLTIVRLPNLNLSQRRASSFSDLLLNITR
jgi:hypothetical protein